MQKLFKSISTVFLLLIFVKLIDVSRNLIVAATLGVNNNADIYLGLITIPESLLIFTGFDSLKGVVNSEFSHIRNSESLTVIRQSFSNLLRIVSIFSIICLIFLLIFREHVISLLLPGFLSEKRGLAVSISLIILPIFFFKALFNVIQPLYNSFKSYNLPTIAPVILSICVLGSLLIPNVSGQILYNLAFANLLGNIILFLILFLISFKLISHLEFTKNWFDPLTKRIIKSCSTVFVLVMVNQVYLSSRNVFVSYFGEGAISSISYASNLPQFISTFIFSMVFGIILSELSSGILNNEGMENSKKYYNTFLSLSYFVFPVVILFLIYYHDVLSIIYLRGNFTEKNISNLTIPFIWESLSLVTFILSIMPTALYLAYKKYFLLSKIGIISFLIGIFLNYYLTLKYGFYGVSIAGFLTTALYGIILIFFSIRIIHGFKDFVTNFIKLLFISLITYLVVYLIKNYFGVFIYSRNLPAQIFNVIIGFSFILGIYFLLSFSFRIHYLQKFMIQFKRIKNEN